MKRLLLALSVLCYGSLFSQALIQVDSMGARSRCEGVCVIPLYSDSTCSTFHIVVNSSVAEHYHAEHTEQIYVVSGSAQMTLADSTFGIAAGDWVIIPKGVAHSVLALAEGEELKVISIQTPYFSGNDRVWINSKK